MITWKKILVLFFIAAAMMGSFSPHAHASPECSPQTLFAPLFASYRSNSEVMSLIHDDRIQEAIWLLRDIDEEASTRIENILASLLKEEEFTKIKRLKWLEDVWVGKMRPSGIEVVIKSATPKHEVAAYTIDRMIGLHAVPITVLREQNGVPVSLQYKIRRESRNRERLPWYRKWSFHSVGDLKLDISDEVNRDFFDWLIGNHDRPSVGNTICLQLTPHKWKIALIDHDDMAFLYKSREELIKHYATALLAGSGSVTPSSVEAVFMYADTAAKKSPTRKMLDKIHSIPESQWISELSPLLSKEKLEKFLTRIRETKPTLRHPEDSERSEEDEGSRRDCRDASPGSSPGSA